MQVIVTLRCVFILNLQRTQQHGELNGLTFPHAMYITYRTALVLGMTFNSPTFWHLARKQSLYRPGRVLRVPRGSGSQISRQLAHEGKVVSLMHWTPLLPAHIPGAHLCERLSRSQSHKAARRIISMKDSSDTIGNQTRDNPACRGMPQPSTPPRAPHAPRLYKSADKVVVLLSLRKNRGRGYEW
jgi:hypothetical protein